MFVERLFPTTAPETERAVNAPGFFLLSAVFRSAAIVALTLTVIDVFVSPSAFESPTARLYFVVAMALMMAATKVWVARRKRD